MVWRLLLDFFIQNTSHFSTLQTMPFNSLLNYKMQNLKRCEHCQPWQNMKTLLQKSKYLRITRDEAPIEFAVFLSRANCCWTWQNSLPTTHLQHTLAASREVDSILYLVSDWWGLLMKWRKLKLVRGEVIDSINNWWVDSSCSWAAHHSTTAGKNRPAARNYEQWAVSMGAGAGTKLFQANN